MNGPETPPILGEGVTAPQRTACRLVAQGCFLGAGLNRFGQDASFPPAKSSVPARLIPALAVLLFPLSFFVACGTHPSTYVKRPLTGRVEGGHPSPTADAQQPSVRPAEMPPAPCPARPNVLIIVLDTLRFDATALDAGSRNTTPRLAELAALGVNFTNCYSTHDSTPSSHASLLSGFLTAYNTPLNQPGASVAHQFRLLGYHTFAVVANANLSPKAFPMLMPFEHDVNTADLWAGLSEAQKAAVSLSSDVRIRRFGADPTDGYRMALWSAARRLLPRVRARLELTTQPFLGFVNLMDCHDPYISEPRFYNPARERRLRGSVLAPPRFRKLSVELTNPDSIGDPLRREYVKEKIRQAQGRAWSVAVDLDATDLAIYRMRYEGAVRQADDAIGSIFQALEASGLLKSTVVVITSDHGESFGEAGLLTHSFNEEGDRESTHRVPMLIVFPPCYRLQGVTVKTMCTIADVTPTLYDLVGIDAARIWRLAPPGQVGRSLLPLLRTSGMAVTANISPDPARWTPIAPDQRTQMESEALKRLRALGYVQ